MRKAITEAALASLAFACGPETEADLDPDPPGTLEFEHSHARIYRHERRIDIVHVNGDGESRECGVLTERAHTELEDTLAALDPREDYGYDPEVDQCTTSAGAWVHIEGFDHSPFLCAWYCCRPELAHAALIYSLIVLHFEGGGVNVDGEPYIAIEPDTPCP
ncbi:hypothetical protein [Paraliomyxa miuraensis]|uniref:hypothetical protein n=1 Tax=Paraliomyxa miuraensis TaxID=376150 RepID=UPI00225B25EE|nr:hypothetical protein [Paraliomyxa miuraensis]MCX4241836.1 hypothetical protein [Paraliomyxa miuraensis]